MTITVNVTATDIATNKRADCFQCAVAQAIRRALGDIEIHLWSATTVAIDLDGDYCAETNVKLPREVARAITRLDDNAPVEPFSFPLDIPEAA